MWSSAVTTVLYQSWHQQAQQGLRVCFMGRKDKGPYLREKAGWHWDTIAHSQVQAALHQVPKSMSHCRLDPEPVAFPPAAKPGFIWLWDNMSLRHGAVVATSCPVGLVQTFVNWKPFLLVCVQFTTWILISICLTSWEANSPIQHVSESRKQSA